MRITKEHVEEIFSKIDELVKDSLLDEACLEYVILAKSVGSKENETDEIIKAGFYASFAYFLFSVSEYEESLKMFMKAQHYGYSKNEIRTVIWEAFVEPNINEFRSNYEQNMELVLLSGYISKIVKFDDLPYWLIPTMVKNEYYLYDKHEEIIKEKLYLNVDCNNIPSLLVSDDFADFLILEEWNWSNIHIYINAIKKNNKKSYIVVDNIEKFLSCFQGLLVDKQSISDILIFDGINNMEKYFKECSAYLPRNIINFTGQSEQIKNTIDEIHNYRITKEGRRGDNILLSICIPSYNRGNRAYDNVIHNLQCYYDEEIEIVLSNNGTQSENKEYYEKIEQINDSRLSYFAFKENHGFSINFCKVCDLAQGKFVLLLSDEDLVSHNVLHKIMNMLSSIKETLAIMRTTGDGQGGTPSINLVQPGREALLTYMLTSNYMSGIIFNNVLLKQYNAIEFIKKNLDNSACFYYPHVVLELLLCQYGKVKGTDIVLINEGKAETTEVSKKEIGAHNKCIIPHYASLEGRLEQHDGFLKIFKQLEICQENFTIFREMYIKLSAKTIFLVNFSLCVFYKNTDSDLLKILDKTYRFCVKYLDQIYSSKKDIYKKNYIEDLEEIKRYYEYYKRQI